jgi:activator of HSP90 ATPase
MPYDFTLTAIIHATPQAVYETWLSSRGHSAMTGSKARQSATPGARVMAWDGYIHGKNLELKPGKRIVQSWRTAKFTDTDPDSKITVVLSPVKAGTKLTLKHSRVPDGHTSYEQGGWLKSYFEPMQHYFAHKKRIKPHVAKKSVKKAKKKPARRSAKKAKRK